MPLRAFRRSHLAVSVAERERDHEPLQSVEHHVEILVERLPDAVCAQEKYFFFFKNRPIIQLHGHNFIGLSVLK